MAIGREPTTDSVLTAAFVASQFIMNDLGVHVLLFVLIAFVIVALSVCFSEADDRAASRIFPKRLLTFVGGCVVVAAILLVIERTVASIH